MFDMVCINNLVQSLAAKNKHQSSMINSMEGIYLAEIVENLMFNWNSHFEHYYNHKADNNLILPLISF